jgi:catechol 2,3-dioxygenase-like lactoylglutathione lyase family enzyme
MMNPQVSAITLAVKDIDRAKEFYTQGLGCQIDKEHDGFVSLEVGEGSSTLALYGWEALAEDAGMPADSRGFRAFTLSYIADRAEQVDAVMAAAHAAGAQIGKPARSAIWGGYSGYLTDPDGYLWKVASNQRPPMIFGRRGSKRTYRQPAVVKPKQTAVTLGVNDFKSVKQFYAQGLGCPIDKSFGSFVTFNLGDGSSTLGLYRRDALAKDAGVSADGSGFRGFTLSHIVASGEQVDQMLAKATAAGGRITKPAQAASWAGYSGCFADPDGNLWKVAAEG